MTRRKLIAYCLSLPHSYEDYPFGGDASVGGWTVMRHGANKKGFAHIYERNGRLCVNLKCEPLDADFLRQLFTHVAPAYHMNKTHWNTVTLGGDVPDDELRRLIARSYDLVKPKERKKSVSSTPGERG
ncbi:MAG: MmcQ/YjbR family DNA-binding protein [Candidatus Adiutrix sp.]|nr:MmcQ/YjbR family DNA-binding protein [Candidatus Adiutrix sp.]